MDATVLVPSIALGLIFLLIYLFRCYRSKSEIDIGVMVNAFLLSSGVVCGSFLMVGSVYEPAQRFLKGIDIYIFIAGLAVLAVSIKGLYKDVILSHGKKSVSIEVGEK